MKRKKKIVRLPVTPQPRPAGSVLTKKEIADHLRFTPRYIDQLIAQGMPHMKIGKRRCRFFKDEVDQWMRDRFATRRIGRVNPQPTEAA